MGIGSAQDESQKVETGLLRKSELHPRPCINLDQEALTGSIVAEYLHLSYAKII